VLWEFVSAELAFADPTTKRRIIELIERDLEGAS